MASLFYRRSHIWFLTMKLTHLLKNTILTTLSIIKFNKIISYFSTILKNNRVHLKFDSLFIFNF